MGDVIIVIGGNGFLGHHIIQNLPKYLKTSSHYDYRSKGVMNGPQYTDFDNNTKFAANKVRKIKEVRIIDKNIQNSNYGEENLTIDVEKNIMKKAIKIPITKRKIDILNYEELAESFKDGTIVIHCASLLIADRDYLIKVNVQGTKNVIRACLQQGISILIYTSTVDVCVGMKLSIQTDLDETQSYPEIHLFPNYGGSKLEAELSVLKADGQSLQNVDTMNTNNHVMRTVCLRPCAIYGPLDPYFITESIRIGLRGNEPYFWWKKKKDMEVKYRFPRLNIGNAKIQAAYVGNIAWAHLIAVESMKMGNSQIGGNTFFIADDTPIMNIYDLVKPFFDAKKIELYPRAVPKIFIRALSKLCYYLFKYVPFCQKYFPITLSSLIYLYSSHVVNWQKSKKVLGYTPLFNFKESMVESLEFYKTVKEI